MLVLVTSHSGYPTQAYRAYHQIKWLLSFYSEGLGPFTPDSTPERFIQETKSSKTPRLHASFFKKYVCTVPKYK